jgi:hypothetical protein
VQPLLVPRHVTSLLQYEKLALGAACDVPVEGALAVPCGVVTPQGDERADGVIASASGALVRFEQEGSRLTAVEITRNPYSPVMASLHRALFALGIIVSSYEVRTHPERLTERVVIEREDGGYIEGHLSLAAKAIILPIALQVAPAQRHFVTM